MIIFDDRWEILKYSKKWICISLMSTITLQVVASCFEHRSGGVRLIATVWAKFKDSYLLGLKIIVRASSVFTEWPFSTRCYVTVENGFAVFLDFNHTELCWVILLPSCVEVLSTSASTSESTYAFVFQAFWSFYGALGTFYGSFQQRKLDWGIDTLLP